MLNRRDEQRPIGAEGGHEPPLSAPGHDAALLLDRMREAAAGWTAQRISKETGVAPVTVYRYFQGRHPTVGFLASLAQATGVRLDWLFLGRGPRRDAEETRWAQETASARGLMVELGRRAEMGERPALEAVARLAAPGTMAAAQRATGARRL